MGFDFAWRKNLDLREGVPRHADGLRPRGFTSVVHPWSFSRTRHPSGRSSMCSGAATSPRFPSRGVFGPAKPPTGRWSCASRAGGRTRDPGGDGVGKRRARHGKHAPFRHESRPSRLVDRDAPSAREGTRPAPGKHPKCPAGALCLPECVHTPAATGTWASTSFSAPQVSAICSPVNSGNMGSERNLDAAASAAGKSPLRCPRWA